MITSISILLLISRNGVAFTKKLIISSFKTAQFFTSLQLNLTLTLTLLNLTLLSQLNVTSFI